MKIMLKKLLYLSLYFFIIYISLSPKDILSQEKYLWPTDASRLMTSAFGEYRPDRFHAGIDIKTWNKTGYKVFAVADGYLYRIKTSPFGSGKALYIMLNTGEIAVYYHLENYSDRIGKIVKEEQKNKQKYSIEIWPKAGQYPVRRGEVIAYSGRSGSRLPHLHFEMRDRNNKPVNPLKVGFKPEDKAAPVPTKLAMRPMDINSTVKGDWAPVIVRLKWDKRGYYTIGTPIDAHGRIGLSLDAFDVNGKYDNRYGVYGMTLIVNGNKLFNSNYDVYSFSENRQLNIDRDYRLLRRDKGKFQKLYVDSGNSLGFYPGYSTGDGIIDMEKLGSEEADIEIIIFDFFGNRSKIKGNIRNNDTWRDAFAGEEDSIAGETGAESEKNIAGFTVYKDFQDDYLRIVFTSKNSMLKIPKISIISEESIDEITKVRAVNTKRFISVIPLEQISDRPVEILIEGESADHVYETRFKEYLRHIVSEKTVRLPGDRGEIIFKRGDLFRDFWIRTEERFVQESEDEYDIVGSVIQLEPKEIPFRSNAALRINYPSTEKRTDKLAVYANDNDGNWHYLNSYNERVLGRITVSLSSLETVAILRDTIPPEIIRFRPDASNPAAEYRPQIRVWFDDSLSGIGSEDDIRLFVDGRKVISEWDPIYKYVTFTPEVDMTKGSHTARIVISDRMQNTVEQIWNFTIR